MLLIICLVGLMLLIFVYGHMIIDWIIAWIFLRHSLIRFNKRPIRILLVRHGQSEGNVDPGILTTKPDHELILTSLGEQQAMEAGKKIVKLINNESLYVYLSPYRRGLQTWEGIYKSLEDSQIITIRQDPRLREQEFGNFTDLSIRDNEVAERQRVGRFFYRFRTGESGADVYDRVSLFLDMIFHEMDNGYHDKTQNILIVSHEVFIRLLLMRYFRMTVDEHMNIQRFDNGELVILEKNNGIYTMKNQLSLPTKTS
ncbi:unnamed protein product [Adineta ricciae]|uniref:Phosphoglycerate mutase n=1 Tax=Adineta ricciae TaxID=249248 RepID=A0A815TXL2_ADIRI|nr:unnamed protein product [Adineta ricciae]CAF1514368.1 unnamed protein product [Adineta ricciae]